MESLSEKIAKKSRVKLAKGKNLNHLGTQTQVNYVHSGWKDEKGGSCGWVSIVVGSQCKGRKLQNSKLEFWHYILILV